MADLSDVSKLFGNGNGKSNQLRNMIAVCAICVSLILFGWSRYRVEIEQIKSDVVRLQSTQLTKDDLKEANEQNIKIMAAKLDEFELRFLDKYEVLLKTRGK